MKIDFDSRKWEIFFWINFLWILGTIGLGIITYQTPAPKGSTEIIEAIKIMFLSLGGLGVIIPTYLNVFHSIETKKNERTENTFRLIEKWDNPLLFRARKFTRELKNIKGSLSDNDLIKQINENDELKESVILVLNYFDQIRISLRKNRIDQKLIQDSMCEISKDMYHRLLPYVATHGEKPKRDWEELNRMLNHGYGE